MRFNEMKANLKTALLAVTIFLLAVGVCVAQQQVNLTAGPAGAVLPDGSVVPMWGYTCGAVVSGSAATCTALNPTVAAAVVASGGTWPLVPGTTTTPVWSPVIISVPTGQTLQINLTNNLSFPVGAASPTTTIPTSLVIVGQLGGGLGNVAQRTTDATTNWDHSSAQGATTWPIAGGTGGTPPNQGDRVRSFSTEVVAGTPQSLTWTTPRPGTYLLESGTHPSIQGPMGLYGMVVVTTAPPSGTVAGTAYPAVTYNAEASLLFSEIDPVQNTAVNTAVNTSGFSETKVWSGQPGGCGNPLDANGNPNAAYNTCYPPAVNYTPLYYMVNGVAFNKAGASNSLFAASPANVPAGTGQVLLRLVNAGLRMHVPAIVGSQTTGESATGAAVTVSGFSLIAEDGNPLPGVHRVQSEVFMPAGKTYDVMINALISTTARALAVFDRAGGQSGNAIAHDAGMVAYVSVNGAGLPSDPAFTGATARPDVYNSVVSCTLAPCPTLSVSDPGKGVIANDTNVNGVQLLTAPTGGTLALAVNGTFTYTPNAGTSSDSFTYCANGSVIAATCSSGITAQVTLGACGSDSSCVLEAAGGIVMNNITYTSNVAATTSNIPTTMSIKPPGILSVDKDNAGYALKVSGASRTTPLNLTSGGLTVSIDQDGGFNATVNAPGTYRFSYNAQNSQGTISSASATVTLIFPTANGPKVTVVDGKDKTTRISDYRWIIEEDRTFYINPACLTNPQPAGCPTFGSTGIVPTFGTNFHTSYMPVVAAGCTGPLSCESGQSVQGTSVVCDVGNGVCRPGAQEMTLDPSQVNLDPTKRYYISILPGDAANPFNTANGQPGHGMGGAQIACVPTAPAVTCTASGTFPAVTVLAQPTPLQTAKLAVFVFEDDFPLNGEQDAGGGIDVLATNEPGLGGFEITLFDDAGGTGDATGQLTHDMFNQPLVNSLAGTIDPANGQDACPISKNPLVGMDSSNGNKPGSVGGQGITGRIVTCPTYEADGVTLSPLAGQAVVANMMPGRYGVVATPAADRIARNEEWLQTNTLDGQKAHDSFLRVGEPSYFQEYGPAGYHVSIGFANPKIINSRRAGVCAGTDQNLPLTSPNCNNSIVGSVSAERMSRTPDERLYGSGSYDSFAFTQCFVSIGDPDGEDFEFTKCDGNGNFSLTKLPPGNWRITIFDQWNDMLVDGLSTPVALGNATPGHATTCPGPSTNRNTCDMGPIAMNQWQANIYTTTFFDQNGNGVRDGNEAGLTLVPTNIRFRDGSFSNFNNTDLSGNAGFNEVFPLFAWYVIETDSTRYKSTGTHVVYDSGGPADSAYPVNAAGVQQPCPAGQICSNIGGNMANTVEAISVPTNLRVPGAFYCANADCTDAPSPLAPGGTGGSTGRVDPPWVDSEGWQGFSGQNNFLEFGKTPYHVGENGGIRGHVVYASTRPFDDPQLLLQTSWMPLVPGVTINLYQEGFKADGVTPTLKLVDTTKTSSWDNWAQGFRSDGVPNMNCPGQGRDTGVNGDLFFFTLYQQLNYLDWYKSQHGGPAATALPANAQFKCYDGMHNWNQLQPAPYDGMYLFPSVLGRIPTGTNAGKLNTALTGGVGGLGPNTPGFTPASLPGTNCTICVANPDTTDPWRSGTPMLPPGKYVVEVVVPPGYELVKEEDKNILIGDNYIAPVTQEFGGLGAVFIIPDQAAVGSSAPWGVPVSSTYNANNAQNPTTDLGSLPRHEGDTGSVESFWPCVGAARIVPDYISLFPQSAEVSPFAGATRNLCDRKEVTLVDQSQSLAKFYIFSSTHTSAHYTGIITDDFTSEFDPFSPTFGEKFSPANLPVSIRDFTGTEITRTYSDQWGAFDGLNYSTWEVNPPNPTGYAPTMMVTCMNDPGPIPNPAVAGQTMADPLFNPQYSQFCYEIPFMPAQTQYMDTPVVPTSAFAGAGYNNPDCNYPDLTPAISEVDGDGYGPYVSAAGHTLKIYALGNQQVDNYGYAGPSATAAPFDLKKVGRHYGFGSCTRSPLGVCTNGASVTIGSVRAGILSWTDTMIMVVAPAGVPTCAVQQQAQYAPGATTAQCGELVITAANGKQSIDTVTVTIGGKAPIHVAAAGSIQTAVDAAAPGDLIIIDPATPATATAPAVPAVHKELLLMWKPVRLQGVAAATSIIDGNSHPAGKLDPWRRQVNCLFGLALNGQPYPTAADGKNNPYDPTGTYSCPGHGWNYFSGGPNYPTMVVDRIPLEGILGWDATVNGNIAEQLQEPSLMGAYEGAAITVLSKGVNIPAGSADVFGSGAEAGFPTGTALLTAADCATGVGGANLYPSNFQCNPSSIDALGITDSSQGGGGIFVHAWAHNLQIGNNRVYNNAGTLSGGMSIGQGESPEAYLNGTAADSDPGSCISGEGLPANTQLPYCLNLHLNIHHNFVTHNSSTGDELFTGTPAGAGGVSMCTGADYYKFNFNWVCGNLSTGDGGGVGHIGFSWNGDIEHNTILFNQSTNPTIATNGGGLLVMGAPPDGQVTVNGILQECGSVTDIDCAPGLSDGTGPGLVINANLFIGNGAESGSGGGLRLQAVNGADVPRFINPGPCTSQADCLWYVVSVTNNIIANNVAGWDGGGVSLEDSLVVNFTHNTVASNDSTASSGVLFNTLGSPLASSQSPPPLVDQTTSTTTSAPQPAGIVSLLNSPQLTSSLTTGPITCPANHTNCTSFSNPLLDNDIFWRNRYFYISVGPLGAGTLNQQHVVTLIPTLNQSATGACPAGATYWDIGVRGDSTQTPNSGSGFSLNPTNSVMTSTSGYSGVGLSTATPAFTQYCNGARVPPENGGLGYQVPPGISDATVPNPLFSLLPAATVDEGNNWINMSWGPLSLTNPSVVGPVPPGGTTGNFGGGPLLGNYLLSGTGPGAH